MTHITSTEHDRFSIKAITNNYTLHHKINPSINVGLKWLPPLSIYNPAPYNPSAVEAIPLGISNANKKLQDAAGYSHIRSCIRDVFMRHGVNEKFVLMLLHRHYKLNTGEKIVEHGLVQSPWEIPAEQEEIEDGSVLPKSWRVYEGELSPIEFKFVPKRDLANYNRPIFPIAFVTDLVELLKETGLQDVVGLQLHDAYEESEVELMEITYGRSSIMMPLEELSIPSFVAAWSFVTKENEEQGIVTRHNICSDFGTPTHGVATRHDICSDLSAKDGVATRHNICSDFSAKDGVATRHNICSNFGGANDGVATRHNICSDLKATDGVATRHNICSDSTANDGVATRHNICSDFGAANDGVVTRHNICSDFSAKDGVATRHNICSDFS